MHDEIVVKAAQIRGSGLLHVLEVTGRHRERDPRDGERKKPAGMRQVHIQPGKRIHHAAQHQRGRGDGGLERIAQHVHHREILLDQALVNRVHVVKKKREAECLAPLPHRPERLLAQIPVLYVLRHVDGAHARQARSALQFLEGERRILHRQRDRPDEAPGILQVQGDVAVVDRAG